ncbi:hypothetical protein J2X03_003662 [Microbacterium trichothecenolyticum]|uniref:hypothetical protein n=1 Tax=Microbacterium trichothecenolyticum TaxID=69370 RepID=UPI002859AD93|nr:hypothetical protein [Microbacterium trichothecenolyticum]MDR7113762.1 hypothetical protein [Microbacterium trichothecenolyticum]
MARVDLAGKLSDARARVAAETPPTAPPAPMFAQLARKDARIRDDQVTALAALADAVMRRRRFKAERITENTLIRIAIDLLLANVDRLRGSTEDELRYSVTSGLPKSGSPALTDSAPSGVPAPELAMAAAAAAPDALARGAVAPANPGPSGVRQSPAILRHRNGGFP